MRWSGAVREFQGDERGESQLSYAALLAMIATAATLWLSGPATLGERVRDSFARAAVALGAPALASPAAPTATSTSTSARVARRPAPSPAVAPAIAAGLVDRGGSVAAYDSALARLLGADAALADTARGDASAR